MTCVAFGSLVDVFDVETQMHEIKPIERIVPGDMVWDPLCERSARVHRVLLQHEEALYTICRYLGIRADENQNVVLPGARWMRLADGADWGVSRRQELCKGLAALVLEGARWVRVDGVVCEAHDVSDLTTPRVRVRLGERILVKGV